MTTANAQIFQNLHYADDDYDGEDGDDLMGDDDISIIVLNDSVYGDNETKFCKDINSSHIFDPLAKSLKKLLYS